MIFLSHFANHSVFGWLFPSFLFCGLFGLFNKKITQASTTNNTDNSRVTTLTDSLNTWTSNNLALTNAQSSVVNSAFDATDSFNTVNSFNMANIGGTPDIPALDFTGMRGFFASPDELSDLINANTISKDPNANKYNFDFADISAGGNEFLEKVQGLTRETWEGLVNATGAAALAQNPASGQTSSLMKTAVIVLGVIVAGFVLIKLLKK
jgi:hypothetical protein